MLTTGLGHLSRTNGVRVAQPLIVRGLKRTSVLHNEAEAPAKMVRLGPFWTKNEDGKPLPSQRVVGLVNEYMGLTLCEAADFSDLLKARLRASEDFEQQQLIAHHDARRLAFMHGMAGPAQTQAQPAAAAPAGEKAKDTQPAAAAKTHFELRLESFDAAKRVHVIKEVKGITKLGLKEAKDLVEKAPVVILKDVPKEEAEKHVKLLQEVGGKLVME